MSSATHTVMTRAIDCLEILNKRPRPMCRDCADEDGICPNGGLDCDMRKLIADARAAIAPPVAALGGQLQESLVNLYRYKALPRTVTPGGPIMATITEVFESVNDNTRIIIETSNGGASLRAEAIRPPVAAGSVDTEALRNLALAATRGEWRHTRQGVIVAGPFRQYTNGSAQSQIASFCVTSHEEDDEHQTEKQVPNALFVAAACPDVALALIERAEKAEARTKELELDLLLKNPLIEELRSDIREFKERVKGLEAEDLAMHRKLAAETLRANQGWARYEAANRAKNELEREKAGSASPFFDGLPNEIQHYPV